MIIGCDGAGHRDEFGPDSFWHHFRWAEWWKEPVVSAEWAYEMDDYADLVDEFRDEEDEADWWQNKSEDQK